MGALILSAVLGIATLSGIAVVPTKATAQVAALNQGDTLAVNWWGGRGWYGFYSPGWRGNFGYYYPGYASYYYPYANYTYSPGYSSYYHTPGHSSFYSWPGYSSYYYTAPGGYTTYHSGPYGYRYWNWRY